MQSLLLRGAADTEEKIARIGAARVTVGLSLGLAPNVSSRLFGAPADQVTPAARLLARLFGIRNVALGVWALSMRDARRSERRRCFQINAAVDVADFVVLAPYLFRRGLRRAALISSALAVSATLAWLELLEDC